MKAILITAVLFLLGIIVYLTDKNTSTVSKTVNITDIVIANDGVYKYCKGIVEGKYEWNKTSLVKLVWCPDTGVFNNDTVVSIPDSYLEVKHKK